MHSPLCKRGTFNWSKKGGGQREEAPRVTFLRVLHDHYPLHSKTTPITCHQVRPAPYMEWQACSSCFSNTANLIRFSFTRQSLAHSCKKKKITTQNTTDPRPFTLPRVFKHSFSKTIPCNQAEIKRPAADSVTMTAEQKPRSPWEGRIPKNVIPWQKWAGGLICHRVGHNDETALDGTACRRGMTC